MIPYFEIISFKIGPLTVYVWGILVALGSLLSLAMVERMAPRFGLDKEKTAKIAFRALVAGLVAGRLGHVFLYDPAPFLADPLEILRVWHGGMSSLGGIVGGLLAAALTARRWRLDFACVADTLSASFPLAWAVGRLGCFLIHDHPGALSDSLLAVRYPGGGRFDLGLAESLVGLVSFASLLVVMRFTKRPGAATAAVWYPYLTIRFLIDFLRATDLSGSDVRAFGLLTPMQIAIPFILAALTWHLARIGRVTSGRL